MTKKHYEAIAVIMRKARANATKTQHVIVDVILAELADYFAQDNPRFDRERFLSACGIDLPGVKCPECRSGIDPYYRSCRNDNCDYTQ